jgi:tRNA-Thr(GGU) m(6)t(6)A37 methyltransferase TsaA
MSQNQDLSQSYSLSPIGEIQSPFNEKFGIPRQPGLCNAAVGSIKLLGECNSDEAVKDLSLHSHIWILFLFHQNLKQGWKPSVRPPRLGGNEKMGVLATRSPFRPNGIGMSAVKLLGVRKSGKQWFIDVQGLDLLDGTPVVDIKPYIPYSDNLQEAQSELADTAPSNSLDVKFTAQAQKQLEVLSEKAEQYPKLALLIEQVLQQDPRPSYKQNKADDKIYGILLYNLNIRWQVTNNQCDVLEIASSQ